MVNGLTLQRSLGLVFRMVSLAKAILEKLFLVNRYKETRLNAVARRIQEKLRLLQERKCRLDQIVYASLDNECGYGCHLHTYSVAFMVSYYWRRTLVFAKNHVQGMQDYEDIFLPVAKSCRLHNQENETSNRKSFSQFVPQAHRILVIVRTLRRRRGCGAVRVRTLSGP